jgi:large subunit ribosomal protein L19e
MDISNQKRMAAQVLGCGLNRVRMDPTRMEDISEAVTRKDIRKLVASGAIGARQSIGQSRNKGRFRAAQKVKGRRRGPAHRRGGTNARFNTKLRWMMRIRPIRTHLRELRDSGALDRTTYRRLYLQAKGGMFHNRSHLDTQLRLRGIIKSEARPSTKRAEERRRRRREAARSLIMPGKLKKGDRKAPRKGRKPKKAKPGARPAASIAPAATPAPPEPSKSAEPAGEAGRKEA